MGVDAQAQTCTGCIGHRVPAQWRNRDAEKALRLMGGLQKWASNDLLKDATKVQQHSPARTSDTRTKGYLRDFLVRLVNLCCDELFWALATSVAVAYGARGGYIISLGGLGMIPKLR